MKSFFNLEIKMSKIYIIYNLFLFNTHYVQIYMENPQL